MVPEGLIVDATSWVVSAMTYNLDVLPTRSSTVGNPCA